MRYLWITLVGMIAVFAAAVILLTFADSTDAPEVTRFVTPTATSAASAATSAVPAGTPLPRTWPDAVAQPAFGALGPILIACQDENGDGRLGPDDGGALATGLPDVASDPGEPCDGDPSRADYYASFAPQDFACDGVAAPLHVYVIAGAGTDLLDVRGGESLGLMGMFNLLRGRARELRIPVKFVISTAAVFGTEMAQTNMERLLAHVIASNLDASDCARAVMIGHSHGGVTITSITAALEGRFPGRMLGVLVDRTIALYDRPAEEMPVSTTLINVFQTNEGWHGVHLDAPNVINLDESGASAPIAPSDGGGGPAIVTHKSLDDAPEVQRRIVDEVMRWVVE